MINKGRLKPPFRSFRLQHQLKEPKELVGDEAIPSDSQSRRQGQTTYEQSGSQPRRPSGLSQEFQLGELWGVGC